MLLVYFIPIDIAVGFPSKMSKNRECDMLSYCWKMYNNISVNNKLLMIFNIVTYDNKKSDILLDKIERNSVFIV